MSEVYKKLGNLLKLERERQNIELGKVSEELKITEANLQSVEDGDETTLPSDLYYKLFAKSYAEMLGIDYTRTLDAIKEDLGEEVAGDDSPDGDPESPKPSGKTSSKKSKKKRSEKASSDEDLEGSEEAEDESDPQTTIMKKAMNAFIVICALSIIALAVQQLFFAENDSGSQSEAPAVVSREVPDDPTTGDDDSDLASFNWDVPDRGAPSPLSLKIVAREESWATILADGDTVVFRNLVPWREYSLQANFRLVVSIAHPGVVDVTLNDRKDDLRDTESRRISRVEINQVNMADFPEPTEPTRRQAPRAPEPQVDQETSPKVYGPQIDTSRTDTPTVEIDTTEPDTAVTDEEA